MLNVRLWQKLGGIFVPFFFILLNVAPSLAGLSAPYWILYSRLVKCPSGQTLYRVSDFNDSLLCTTTKIFKDFAVQSAAQIVLQPNRVSPGREPWPSSPLCSSWLVKDIFDVKKNYGSFRVWFFSRDMGILWAKTRSTATMLTLF